jgi:hypothetical protein
VSWNVSLALPIAAESELFNWAALPDLRRFLGYSSLGPWRRRHACFSYCHETPFWTVLGGGRPRERFTTYTASVRRVHESGRTCRIWKVLSWLCFYRNRSLFNEMLKYPYADVNSTPMADMQMKLSNSNECVAVMHFLLRTSQCLRVHVVVLSLCVRYPSGWHHNQST